MIQVKRLNGQDIWINPDMIVSVECTPDAVLTLTNGDKYVLADTVETVQQRFIAYKQQVYLPQFQAEQQPIA